MTRRIPFRVGDRRSRRGFFLTFIFTLTALGAMTWGFLDFLNKNDTTEPLPVSKTSATLLPAPEPRVPQDPEGDTLIMEEGFSSAALVQIYKNRHNPKSYWRLPLDQCNYTQPAIALVVHQTHDLSKTDLEALEKLGIPLTLLILQDAQSYDQAESWVEKHGHDLMLSLPMEPKNMHHIPPSLSRKTVLMRAWSPKRMGEHLEALVGDKKILGVASRMGSAFSEDLEAMECLLLHLKHRGLVFLDSLTTPHGTTQEGSRKVLALSLRRHLHWAQGHKTLNARLKKSGKVVLYVPLKRKILGHVRSWVRRQQKRGVSFIPLRHWFCQISHA